MPRGKIEFNSPYRYLGILKRLFIIYGIGIVNPKYKKKLNIHAKVINIKISLLFLKYLKPSFKDSEHLCKTIGSLSLIFKLKLIKISKNAETKKKFH